METNDKYLVEFFYKIGRKTRRVYSFISSNDRPAPVGMWYNIDYGVAREFESESAINYSNLSVRITWLQE